MASTSATAVAIANANTASMNTESLAPLRQKQGKIYYGFDSNRLHIHRGDEKSGPATSRKTQEDPTGKGAKITSGNNKKVQDDAPLADSQKYTKSNSGMVGEFFGGLQDDELEDESLETDLESELESVNDTVVYERDSELDSN